MLRYGELFDQLCAIGYNYRRRFFFPVGTASKRSPDSLWSQLPRASRRSRPRCGARSLFGPAMTSTQQQSMTTALALALAFAVSALFAVLALLLAAALGVYGAALRRVHWWRGGSLA